MALAPDTDRRRLWPWLTVWTLVGLGIRFATLYGRPNRAPGGDPGYAWGVANLVVGGRASSTRWPTTTTTATWSSRRPGGHRFGPSS